MPPGPTDVVEPRRGRPEVVHVIDALDRSSGRLYVVVGVFDGLHLGHLYLLDHLRRVSEAHGARSAVVTFDHHPDEVIVGAAPPLLCDPEERLALLADAGVEVTIVQTFDPELRMTPFDDFVRRIADRVDLAGFLMTPDAAFGHDRGGTPASVADLGTRLGYDVTVVPPLLIDGRAVRSSDIRTAIADGRLADAARMLGRAYSVIGEVAAAPDDRSEIRFAMPVALPPPGSYDVLVAADPTADAEPRRVTAFVSASGKLQVDATPSLEGSSPVRVTFG